MIRLALIAVLALGACGVDGPPRRPSAQAKAASDGVAISGDVRIGVSAEL